MRVFKIYLSPRNTLLNRFVGTDVTCPIGSHVAKRCQLRLVKINFKNNLFSSVKTVYLYRRYLLRDSLTVFVKRAKYNIVPIFLYRLLGRTTSLLCVTSIRFFNGKSNEIPLNPYTVRYYRNNRFIILR